MTPRVLPVTITPHPGESMESWLEHLADANGLATASLLNLIRDDDASGTRYLTFAPSTKAMTRIAVITGIDITQILATTTASFEDTAVNLHGLDHEDRHSYRTVAARGWVRSRGTQICPSCLAETGIWMTAWRLPIVTVCTRHETLIVAACPTCQRPFRDQHHSHLRRTGPTTSCGNPLGAGPSRQCEHDLRTIPTTPAKPRVITMQHRVNRALKGSDTQVLGEPATGDAYLTDIRHLATLLMHLAAQPGADDLAEWVGDIREAARGRTGQRGPRWGLRPPDDPQVRGPVLATADSILTSPDLNTAATIFLPWLETAPTTVEGPYGWLSDRTVVTETLSRLIIATRASACRLSHYLDHTPSRHVKIDTRSVPQVIPQDMYSEHLADVCTGGEKTIRLYASLCLARLDPTITSWAKAAHALNMPTHVGTNAARACSHAILVDNTEWTRRLENIWEGLRSPLAIRWNYRNIETQILHRNTLDRWFDNWCRRYRPATHRASKGHALTWQWVHVAHGHLNLAPSWNEARPVKAQRDAYHQFESSLDNTQQTELEYSLRMSAGQARKRQNLIGSR